MRCASRDAKPSANLDEAHALRSERVHSGFGYDALWATQGTPLLSGPVQTCVYALDYQTAL
jgi:hypothetical protein